MLETLVILLKGLSSAGADAAKMQEQLNKELAGWQTEHPHCTLRLPPACACIPDSWDNDTLVYTFFYEDEAKKKPGYREE